MRRSWCAQNAILSDHELLDTVCSTNLRNQLRNLWVPVASITTNDEEGSIYAFWDREEDTGNEGFGVVLLLEDLDLLAETGTV